MKNLLLLPILFLSLGFLFFGYEDDLPEADLPRATPEAHITYLASDELRGRDTGTPGNDQAAAYIAEQYQRYGLEWLPGMTSFLQPVPLGRTAIPETAEVSVDGNTFVQGENLILLNGPEMDLNAMIVFADYGWVDAETGHDDYKELDVQGKIVLTIPGSPSETGMRAAFNTLADKQKWAVERGAIGVLQLYQVQFPWSNMKRRYGRARLQLMDSEANNQGFSGWVYGVSKELLEKIKQAKTLPVKINSSGFNSEPVHSSNVAGLIKGTDPDLQEEYILLTAHYDHVGVGQPDEQQDSIFNGARDNAMGVAALLAAAETLAKKRPKRSVIVLAVTAEEKGLLGSRYYADHPLIPLENTIFNINSDGGGYNDTTAVAAIGYGRTGTDSAVEAAVQLAGLDRVIPNPEPRQNFFDRSDNVSFARKGVPCLAISPGFSEFDDAMRTYYHRPADEVSSLDFDYVLRYCKVFAHTARLVADSSSRPQWVAGDKYEGAGKKLYGED